MKSGRERDTRMLEDLAHGPPPLPTRSLSSTLSTEDVLEICLQHCGVVALKAVKAVSRAWAQRARRTLCSAGWRVRAVCYNAEIRLNELDAYGLSCTELHHLLLALRSDGVCVEQADLGKGPFRYVDVLVSQPQSSGSSHTVRINLRMLVANAQAFAGSTPLVLEMALIRAAYHGDANAAALLLSTEGIDANAVDDDVHCAICRRECIRRIQRAPAHCTAGTTWYCVAWGH